MNKSLISLLTTLLLFSCNAPKVDIAIVNGLVIKNADIVSPLSQDVSSNNFIVLDGDSIAYIGQQEPHVKGTFTTLDAKGKFIIPGLIDSHVHITGTDALSEEEEIQNPEIVAHYKNQLPKSYLYFGYTTIIDLGTAHPDRLQDFLEAEIKPDLFYVGGGAVIGNGYGLTNWSDEVPNFIYQENEAYPIPEEYQKENHTPKAVAKRVGESGAIALKTYYEPGFDPTIPSFPTPTFELMADIKKEAHRNNLTLVVHGNSLEAHDFLGQANVDVIAHGLWNWGKYSLGDSLTIPKEIQKVLDTEIENQVGYMPTLQVINGLKILTNASFLNSPELDHVLPQDLITYYKEHSETMYANIFGDAPKEIIETNFTRISDQGKINLMYMYKNGGNILFGTDSPSSPTYGNPPGYNGYLEMMEMADAGLPLNKILSMATIENAKAFRLDDKYGSVEEGKRANLLVLNKNPLLDITAYNDISHVIINGKPINRETL
ncbi:MAG: amidohydrolase family protein, partial [Bacteroidota bacterium]|nr:amidohydrolase family protein [Bacteroidota bacterium]